MDPHELLRQARQRDHERGKRQREEAENRASPSRASALRRMVEVPSTASNGHVRDAPHSHSRSRLAALKKIVEASLGATSVAEMEEEEVPASHPSVRYSTTSTVRSLAEARERANNIGSKKLFSSPSRLDAVRRVAAALGVSCEAIPDAGTNGNVLRTQPRNPGGCERAPYHVTRGKMVHEVDASTAQALAQHPAHRSPSQQARPSNPPKAGASTSTSPQTKKKGTTPAKSKH